MKKYLLFVSFYYILYCSITFSQSSQGLIGYWPFIGNANDLSGYNNNGIIYNATLTSDRFGKPYSAFYFSGVNSYVDCGNNIPPLTNQMTVSVWIKTSNSNSNVAYIVGKYGWNSNYAKGFHMLMYNFIQFAGRDQIDTYNYIMGSNFAVNDNLWHHLVGAINNSVYELWIDGIKVASLNNYHTNVDLSQNFNLYVGGHFNNGLDQNMHFIGAIDDVRLYNRALTSTEILQLFTEGSFTATIYTVTALSNPTNGGLITGDGGFLNGQTAKLTAKANQDFLFINWTEDNKIVSTGPSYQFPVNDNRTIIANFKKTNIQITASTNPFVGGAVSGIGAYAADQLIKIIARAYPGYKFLNWTEDGTVISSDSSYQFVAIQDRILMANFIAKTSSIDRLNSGMPISFYLYQNFPNPFNPTTEIQFTLPVSETVILKIFDVLGKEVVELVNRELSAGIYSINFDASELKTGVYFYTIQAGTFHQTRKLILMK